MNKRKKVAWRKHRESEKKTEEKRRAAGTITTPVKRPRATAKAGA